MILLTRYNKWDTQFTRERIFLNVDTDVMARDRRRVRKMKYPSEIVRKEELIKLQRNDVKEFENEFYWMKTSVQTPITMAKAGLISWEEAPTIITPNAITRREPLVEDILISYSKIKAMKFGKK